MPPMTIRSLFFALGVGTLWGGYRAPMGKLPDSANAKIAFAPDGREIYVLSGRRMYAWDVESRRIVRERSIAKAESGMTLSPGGAFAVLAAQDEGDSRAQVELIRTRDGETVLTRELGDGGGTSEHWYPRHTSQLLAASDDGRWLAAYRLEGGEVEVAATDGHASFRFPAPGHVDGVAFNSSGDQLSISHLRFRSVLLFSLARGKWALSATLEGAFHPAWTARGLSFQSAAGIELREGSTRRVAVRAEPQYGLDLESVDPPWRISPDGSLCVLWNKSAFTVRETSSGALLAAHEVDARRTPAVGAVGFLPGRLRAFLATGEVYELDLASRSLSLVASFGRPGHYQRNLFQDGASWQEQYAFLLSPTGRHLLLRKPDSAYQIYFIE